MTNTYRKRSNYRTSKKIIIFRNNVPKKFILYGGIIMGVIKEGVLPEAGSIIGTLTVLGVLFLQ